MTTINGTDGNDELFGTAGDDLLNGLGGNDNLTGHAGNDTLQGGTGDDVLVGGAGNDTLQGDAGTDQVVYYRETGTAGIYADLSTGIVTDTHGGTDILSSVEILYGSSQNDTVLGSAGGDFVFGYIGNDSILGGGGDDTLIGDQGNDTLIGGAGIDQVAYFLETGSLGVVVDLGLGTARDTWGHTDTLNQIERILGSDHNDTIVGSDASNDLFYGRSGNDSLNGRAGDDTLVGDEGADTLTGGAGSDQVAYFLESGTQGVSVDLRAGTATDTWGHSDRLSGIEIVHGSNNDDTIYGSDVHGDILFGRDGNDYMDGRDGNDLYYTGDGNDTIMVGGTIADARDTIVVDGNGHNTILGGDSEGTRYGHHIVFEIDEAVTVDLAAGTASSTSGAMTTDFSQALYFLELGGTMHADTLVGGNPRHDYLEWFVGNQGNDTINGGSGQADTIVYEDEVTIGSFNFTLGVQEYGSQAVVVNLATGVATDTFGFTDTLINIDDIRATEFNDGLTGSAGANSFWGLAGADTLRGGDGVDSALYGEDYLHGGTAGINANLVTGQIVDGYGHVDTVVSIENVYGTEAADTMQGDAAENRFFGYGGNDTMRGGDSHDDLLGGDGNDAIFGEGGDDELGGGAGNDTLDGGAGEDLVRYLDASGGVTLNLATGTASDGDGGTDVLTSIEHAHGSENGDSLTGDTGANELSGFGGDDSLYGGVGADTLLGGAGYDYLEGGSGDDELWGGAGTDMLVGGDGTDRVRYLDATSFVSVDLAIGRTLIDGFNGEDTLVGIEDVHGSTFNDTLGGDASDNELRGFDGADSLSGQSGNDTLLGGAGDDIILGGWGDDEIWGNDGNDTLNGEGGARDLVRYRWDFSGVEVNLATGQAIEATGTDTLIGIEDVHTSDHNDTVTGSGGDNRIFGFGGDDTLLGGAGNDTILGGAGNDSIEGGAGDDEIWGDAGNDTLNGGVGTGDLIRYRNDFMGVSVDLGAGTATAGSSSDGTAFVDTLVDIENADGSDHGDLLVGSDAANRLFGYAGNDTIRGGAGNDVLLGGDGSDLIEGGDGNDEIWGEAGGDTLDGGDGVDLVRYRYATTGVTVNLSTGEVDDGQGARDRLSNIEQVHGSDYDDLLVGSVDDNLLQGFAGDDTMVAGPGTDVLSGGTGADTYEFYRGAGYNTVNDLGNAGETDIVILHDYTASQATVLRQNPSNEAIVLNFGITGDIVVLANTLNSSHSGAIEQIQWGDGTIWSHANLITALDAGQVGVLPSATPTSGNDEIYRTPNADSINALDGDDIIYGLGGNDTLEGGAGADTIYGGAGDDLIIGNDPGLEFGSDRLIGGEGNDTIIGHDSFSDEQVAVFEFDLFDPGVHVAWDGANTITVTSATGVDTVIDIQTYEFAGQLWSRSAVEQVAQNLASHRITSTLPPSVTSTEGAVNVDFGQYFTDTGGGDVDFDIRGLDGLGLTINTDTGVVSGAIQAQLDAATPGVSSYMVEITATVASNDTRTETVEWIVNNVNAAPTGTVEITGVPRVHNAVVSVLTADTSGLSDADGMSDLSYQWLRDGVEIFGETHSSYMLSALDIGAQMSVQVTYLDGFGTTESVTSDVTDAVAVDATGSDLAVTGVSLEDEVLGVDVSALTGMEGTTVLTYQWLRDGSFIVDPTTLIFATQSTYQLTDADVGRQISVIVGYSDGQGLREEIIAPATAAVANINDDPTGAVTISGTVAVGQTLTANVGTVDDEDGLGAISYQWMRGGVAISSATNASYTLGSADIGAEITVQISFTDAHGTDESLTSDVVFLQEAAQNIVGTSANERLTGASGNDTISGLDGNDTLIGNAGDDSLLGGDGVDILNGGDGNDTIIGGATEADLRDVVYAGDGNDSINGGYGNDELRGDAGDDSIEGSYGVDVVIGGDGNDVLTGSAWSDEIYGGNGDDFINGGFGYDRVNGGTGADRFYHIGIYDHGSDWIQDYNAAEGDVLFYGGGSGPATADDFLIQRTFTPSAGSDTVQEIFVTHIPSGNLLWALVDGDAQGEINIRIGTDVFDLLV